MTTSHLDSKDLDRFISFSGWKEQVSPEPLPGPSPSDATWSRRAAIDRIRATVRTVLVRSIGLSADAPFVLRKPVCVAALLGRASAEQYAVLCEICDILRGHHDVKFIAPLEDETAWNEAISIVRRVRQFAEHDSYTLNSFSRAHAVAKACQRLEARGFTIQLTAHGVGTDDAVLAAVCADIEERLRHLGGRRVIDAIFKQFETEKRIYEGSLLYGRNVNQIPQPREPSIPWHFLYNMAWKHWDAVPTSLDPVRDFKELVELARDMAAVFDVEAYNSFEGISISPTSFHQGILDRIVYDELFAFQQWQPKIASRVLSSWLRHLTTAGCTLPLARFEQWDAIASSLIAKAQLCALAITHPSEHVGPTITSSKAAALFDALALPLNHINKGYATPLNTAKRNTPYYPLYKVSADIWVLPPRGMAARALFERIYALLRNAKAPDLENRMATALERMTAEAVGLTGHPPAYAGLRYRASNQRKGTAPYELDVADATGKHVFLLECKKKSLTNTARAGNTLSAAVDFAQAFLMPLVQMNRHEAQLRVGGINFLNGSVLQLDGRDIQRIAVTMTDHGSMQDRMFLRAILIGLWGARLTALHPEHQDDAEKVNEQLNALAEGITLLASRAGGKSDDFVQRYVRSSWWLSIDQLYFLCERTRDLRDALFPLGSVTFSTGDLMNEIAHCDQIGLLKRKT
jgi:hypothetical protein